MSKPAIIDAHQHFWDLGANDHPWLRGPERIPFRYGDYGEICRDYLPPDYRRDTAGYDIAGTVHMEAEVASAEAVAETLWLERLAAESGLPCACVAQARLNAPNVDELLARQAERPMVRGVRHKPVAASDRRDVKRGTAGGMDDLHWRRGYALLERHGLSFDLQAPWWHAAEAAALAADFPAIPLIVNHTFLPADRSDEGLAGWRVALSAVARQPNVTLKISGLGLAGRPWRAEENVPLMQDAITALGWQRCLFASNFPVDSLVATFATIADAFGQAVARRAETEQRALWHGNAARVYRLPQQTGAEQPR